MPEAPTGELPKPLTPDSQAATPVEVTPPVTAAPSVETGMPTAPVVPPVEAGTQKSLDEARASLADKFPNGIPPVSGGDHYVGFNPPEEASPASNATQTAQTEEVKPAPQAPEKRKGLFGFIPLPGFLRRNR